LPGEQAEERQQEGEGTAGRRARSPARRPTPVRPEPDEAETEDERDALDHEKRREARLGAATALRLRRRCVDSRWTLPSVRAQAAGSTVEAPTRRARRPAHPPVAVARTSLRVIRTSRTTTAAATAPLTDAVRACAAETPPVTDARSSPRRGAVKRAT
jgi:hypothetical protein